METPHIKQKIELIVIGGSAGSLDVILHMAEKLDKQVRQPIVIVLHRKNDNDSTLVALIQSRSTRKVKEVRGKDLILPDYFYIAPADYHVLLEKNLTFSLDYSEKVNYSRPSIDVTFESAADVYGNRLLCLLLSGANADGVEGMRKARKAGAVLAIQDPATADVPYMPKQALTELGVSNIIEGHSVAAFINSITS